jgi:hypothetical protein
MPLLQLVGILIVVGVLLWLVNRYIPMQGTIKSMLNGVVVIVVAVWLLKSLGLWQSLPTFTLADDELRHNLSQPRQGCA